MKTLLICLLLSRILFAANLYVLDGNVVDVFDTTRNTKIHTISGFTGSLLGIAISPTDPVAYILVSDGSVTVIDTISSIFVKNIPGVVQPQVTAGPLPIAFTPDGSSAYVLDCTNNSITIINTSNFALGSVSGTGLSSPYSIAMSPVSNKAYVTNHAGSSVSMIDTSLKKITGTISTPAMSQPCGAAVSLDGTQLYVTDSNLNQMYIINTTSNTITNTISQSQGLFSNPFTIGFNPPNGPFAYVTNMGNGTVSILTTDTYTLQTVATGSSPQSIAFMPDGSYIYILNSNSDTVSVISEFDNMLALTISGPFSGTITAIGIAKGLPSVLTTPPAPLQKASKKK